MLPHTRCAEGAAGKTPLDLAVRPFRSHLQC
jgi:hypothetical protein